MRTMELRTSLISEVSALLDNDELMSEAIHLLRGLRSRVKGYARQEEESCNHVVSEPPCQYTMNEMQEHLELSRQDIKSGRCYTQEDMKKNTVMYEDNLVIHCRERFGCYTYLLFTIQ